MTIIISAAPARIALTGRAIIWALNSEVSWILALGVGLTVVSRYGDAGRHLERSVRLRSPDFSCSC